VWSQSASLKTEDPHRKKKHHVVRRLNKAVHYAQQLSDIIDSRNLDTTVSTRLEARAYKSSLAGQSAFERKQWGVALREYSVAKIVLEVLMSKADDSLRPIYKEASSAVDPGLRYCCYQLQITSEADVVSLARKFLPQDAILLELLKTVNGTILEARRDSSARAGITSIQWRSRTARLEHPEIVVQLLKVQDMQALFEERVATFDLSATERAAAMDDVLNAWAEAEDVVRRVLEDRVGVTGQAREQSLQVILTYVSFHFIATRIQRDVLLVRNLERRRGLKMPVLKDLVRLHDSVLQVDLLLSFVV
jgi:hypothetical protein